MKRKAERKGNLKIEKKPGNLIRIYDLYIQRTEGFYVKVIEKKYIYYKQVQYFDIIRQTNLYPRFIWFQRYTDSELIISHQNDLFIKNNNCYIMNIKPKDNKSYEDPSFIKKKRK